MNESAGFVCLLAVVFIIVGIIIIWVFPVVVPSFQENGANLHGWWLVVFGGIGMVISCFGGSGGARHRHEGQQAGE